MNLVKLSVAISSVVVIFSVIGATSTRAQVPVPGRQAGVLEEVVVTARKRSESLQTTPISMTVLSGAQIKAAGLPDVTSLERISPNLAFATSSDGGSSTVQAFIRGVGQFDFAITTDPGVGIYIDGVYQARTVGANMQFADIQQISVLRGPQGTLFGKNTIGGAIDIKTRVPSGKTAYSIEGKVGSYGFHGFNGYIEFPLVENKLSASFSILRESSNGWQKRSGTNAGNDDMWGGRAHLYWTPTEDFSSHLVVDGVWQEQSVYPRVLAAFDKNQLFPRLYNIFVAPCCTPNSDIDRSNIPGGDDRDDLKSHGLSWTNQWRGSLASVKSITGYSHMHNDTHRESDNKSQPPHYQSISNDVDHEQFSQEFIFSGTGLGDRVDWVAGLYYFQEHSGQVTNVNIAEGLYQALVGLPLSVTLPDGTPLAYLAQPLDLTLYYDRSQDTHSYAAYFHTIWKLTDSLKLTLAGRYTYEKKELSMQTLKRASQTPILDFGPTGPGSCSDVIPWGNGSQFTCDKNWSEFSPNVGLDWQITGNVMTYAHVSRGFRSGVFNGRPTSTVQVSVANPEFLTSYEVGFKTEFAGRRLRLNGAVFYDDYKDQQFLVNRASAAGAGGLALVVANAGKSNLRGFELEFTALPAEGFTIDGAVGYVDPTFDQFTSLTPDSNGNLVLEDESNRPFANTPKWTGHLGFQYQFDLPTGDNIALRTDLSYKDDVYYSNDTKSIGFEALHENGYTTVDAGIIFTTRDNHWQFALHGLNLTDERKINGGFVVDAFGVVDTTYTAPRRYFFSITYKGGA